MCQAVIIGAVPTAPKNQGADTPRREQQENKPDSMRAKRFTKILDSHGARRQLGCLISRYGRSGGKPLKVRKKNAITFQREVPCWVRDTTREVIEETTVAPRATHTGQGRVFSPPTFMLRQDAHAAIPGRDCADAATSHLDFVGAAALPKTSINGRSRRTARGANDRWSLSPYSRRPSARTHTSPPDHP